MDDLVATLKQKLRATHVQIKDQSHLHLHHNEGGSGHYEVTIVSPYFRNQNLIQQHRSVYNALSEEMGTVIHALAIRSFTPEEWESQ